MRLTETHSLSRGSVVPLPEHVRRPYTEREFLKFCRPTSFRRLSDANLRARGTSTMRPQEHPLVAPHVSHFSHVPFLTIVKFWHSEHMLPV